MPKVYLFKGKVTEYKYEQICNAGVNKALYISITSQIFISVYTGYSSAVQGC